MALTITNEKGSLEIINVYAPPNNELNREIYKQVFSARNALICGDFNAKSPLWGSPIPDSRGSFIVDVLESTNKVVLNTGEPTHFYNLEESHIDLTFSDPKYAHNASWQVLDESCGSDHYIIQIDLATKVTHNTKIRPRWLFDKANWSKFSQLSDSYLSTVDMEQSIESINDAITKSIIRAADSTIPKSKGTLAKKHQCAFWNAECERSVKERERAKRVVKRSRNPIDLVEFKRKSAIAKRTIKKAKTDKWQNYCSSFNCHTKLADAWKLVKRMNNSDKSSTIRLNDKNITSNFDIANIFADQFAKVSSTENFDPTFIVHKEKFEREHSKLLEKNKNTSNTTNSLFKMKELKRALKKGASTSPGKDELCYEMFRHLSDASQKIVLRFMNMTWQAGTIPDAWRHAIVIPILKPGKPKGDPKSYRPISLTSNFCKLMERMIAERLRWHLDANQILCRNQAGFRKKRCTIDQLIRLSDDIVRNISNGNYVLGVFIDIERAFDMLWKGGLLYKLNKIGVGGQMFNWIKSYLDQRTIQTRIGDSLSNLVRIANGVPQGGVLSPLLFLIAINDLNPPGVEISKFADDAAIWTCCKDDKIVTKRIQKAMKHVEEWCDRWGFKISGTKTKVVLFHRKRVSKIPNIEIRYKGQVLPREDEVRFLGLIFDQRLTWKSHIDYLHQRCQKRVNVLKAVSGTQWGASKETLLLLYKGLIRSCLDYGSEIYDTASPAQKSKLDKIQYQCLRICCGAMASTATSALQVECGEMPLDLRRLTLQVKSAIKYKYFADNPANNVLLDTWHLYYSKVHNDSFRSFFTKTKAHLDALPVGNEIIVADKIPKWELDNLGIHTDLHEIVDKKCSTLMLEQAGREYVDRWSESRQVFTDGSKKDNVTTCAYTVPGLHLHQKARLTDDLSIYKAELTAIQLALEQIHTMPQKDTVIFSDSLSALQGLANLDMTDALLSDVRTRMHNLSKEGSKLELAWIPSHVGIHGNEIADKLAKEALDNTTIDRVVPHDIEGIVSIAKGNIEQIWQDRWNNDKKARHYHALEPKVNSDIKFKYSNRRGEVAVTRLRLGHCRLNKHLQRLGIRDNGLCSHCNEPEDISHFLLKCMKNPENRRRLERAVQDRNLDVTVKNLLTIPELVEALWEYIKDSKTDI